MRRALVVLLAVAACSSGLPTADVRFHLPSGRTAVIRAEVPGTDEERARGLMDRDSLAADRGMLFRWPTAGSRDFYMFRTRIPLDLISLKDGRVTQIASMVPCPESAAARCPTTSAGLVDAVLEVNAGTADRLGITVGARVDY